MKTRIAVAVVGCAAALAAGATAALASQDGSAAMAGAAGSAVPRCVTEQLSAGLHGFQAGLGNRGLILTLTNTGNGSCTLYGYPDLGLENASHGVLPSHTDYAEDGVKPENYGLAWSAVAC